MTNNNDYPFIATVVGAPLMAISVALLGTWPFGSGSILPIALLSVGGFAAAWGIFVRVFKTAAPH